MDEIGRTREKNFTIQGVRGRCAPKHRNSRRETVGWYRKIARGVCSLLKWHGREHKAPGPFNFRGSAKERPGALQFAIADVFYRHLTCRAWEAHSRQPHHSIYDL